jgi:uncharacterized membrane protein YciS (DUF1049 family)
MGNQKTSVVSLFLWGVAIAISIAIVWQNLQPLVIVYFLGKSTIPLPLSLAILAAFAIGGMAAFLINLVAFWLNPDRKISNQADQEQFEDEDDEFEDNPAKSNQSKPYPQSPPPKSDDTVRYGANYEDEDFDDDDDDVIDVKYLNR